MSESTPITIPVWEEALFLESLSIEEVSQRIVAGEPVLLGEGFDHHVIREAIRHHCGVGLDVPIRIQPLCGFGSPPKNALVSCISNLDMVETEPKNVRVQFRRVPGFQ